MPDRVQRNWPWLWYCLAILVIALDQISKWVVVEHLYEGQVIPVTSWFEWVLRYNPGAAFSFLHDAGGWQRWFLGALAATVAIVLVVWMARLAKQRYFELAGLSLILGGAVGNLIDRVRLGEVVDFIAVHWPIENFPAFNLADSAISVGAALLIFDVLFIQRRHQSAGEQG